MLWWTLYKSINGLNKKFPNACQSCNGDVNEFVLLLRKGVYPCEYSSSCEKSNETLILDKEAFYSKLHVESITDEDHAYYKKVINEFGLKNLGEYHDLYVQSNTLLLPDVFENFRDKCIEIYELDPAPGLAWPACLKKTGLKLELLTNHDMSMMVGKGIRGRICQAIYRYEKANNKYMKNYNKFIESFYQMYLDAKNLYGRTMSQKLHVDDFK